MRGGDGWPPKERLAVGCWLLNLACCTGSVPILGRPLNFSFILLFLWDGTSYTLGLGLLAKTWKTFFFMKEKEKKPEDERRDRGVGFVSHEVLTMTSHWGEEALPASGWGVHLA